MHFLFLLMDGINNPYTHVGTSVKALDFLLLAGLLSVRYAPVSEGTKACKEAKA